MDEHLNAIIIRYLQNEATPEEIEELSNWRNQNDHEEQFQEMVQVWQAAAQPKVPQRPDVAKAWDRFSSTQKPQRTFSQSLAFRVVALLVVGLGTTFIYFQNTRKNHQITVRSQTTTTEVLLPDGSVVWLASNSSLSYPEKFGRTRKVNLKGQGFFEVTRNESSPFKVQTEKTTVTVLGTGFNVNQRNDETEVIVATGKVAFEPEKDSTARVVLSPGDRGIFAHPTTTIS
ncbi:MAG: FecR domain-containing protein, partial [Cyclobacteriaceae bacterium]